MKFNLLKSYADSKTCFGVSQDPTVSQTNTKRIFFIIVVLIQIYLGHLETSPWKIRLSIIKAHDRCFQSLSREVFFIVWCLMSSCSF